MKFSTPLHKVFYYNFFSYLTLVSTIDLTMCKFCEINSIEIYLENLGKSGTEILNPRQTYRLKTNSGHM